MVEVFGTGLLQYCSLSFSISSLDKGGTMKDKHWVKSSQLMDLYWVFGYDIDIFPVANSLLGNW